MTLLDPPIAAASTLYSQQAVGNPGSVARDFYVNGPQLDVDRRVEIQLAEANPRAAWLAGHIEDRLNGLFRLRAGWDGFRARPLSDISVEVAVRVFFAIVDEMTFPPQLFPLVDGGLQLEWHAAGEDLEIEVDGEGLAHLLNTDPDGEVRVDTSVTLSDSRTITQARVALHDLSQRIATGLSARG